jgi:hypothetical protein
MFLLRIEKFFHLREVGRPKSSDLRTEAISTAAW